MKQNFDTPLNRFNTDSVKWDVDDNELPMWVADMDFQTAPEIIEAFKAKVEHGVFGYTNISDEWANAYSNWWKIQHSFALDKDSLIYCTGVVSAISSIIRKITTVGEKILIQSPVYNIFYNSIVNNGRLILENKLVYKEHNYKIDFIDLEIKLSDPQTSLMILCNPHNPIGKIWSRDILKKIGELCCKHNVVVLSDEIHCDLTDPGFKYTPFASVSEECKLNSITCIAPTKAFNIAGIQTAAVYIPNEVLKHKIKRGLNTDEVAEPNAFATIAAITAFTHGEGWLTQLRGYLLENKKIVREFINSNIPQVSITDSQATYLMWLDVKKVSKKSHELQNFLRKETGLYLTDGSYYGSGGKGFLRMNIACPLSRVEDALRRLKIGVNNYIKRCYPVST